MPPPAYSPRLPAILSKEAPSDSPPVLVSAPSLLNPEAPSFQMPETSPGPVFVEIEVPRRTVSFDVPPSPRPLLRPDEKSTAAPCVGRACLDIAAECKQRITVLAQQHDPTMIGKIAALLAKYKGEEDVLYFKVCKKFGVQPFPLQMRRPPD